MAHMDVLRSNLTSENLSLVVGDSSAKKGKKLLFNPNVVLSFVGKLPLPKITIHAKLPHRPSGVDVCLIVKDLKKADYDASNDQWKRKWRSDSSKSPNKLAVTFLPISELKLCYQSFESRRKLAATFDVFLADKRIVHHLPTNLGKAFYGKSRDKIPIPVNIEDKNLVTVVEKALSTCLINISGKGTTESVVIGNTGLSKDELRENAFSVIDGVLSKLPDGLKAIRSIYLRGIGPSVPVYYDNSDVSSEESKAKLKELKADESSKIKLQKTITSIPSETLIEAIKSLPITESDLNQILKKTGRKVKRTASMKKSGQKKSKKAQSRKSRK